MVAPDGRIRAGGKGGAMAVSVIFDLDGTLIDSLPDIHATLNRVVAARGLAPFSTAEVAGFVGLGAGVLIDRALAARLRPASEAPEVLAAFLAQYESAVHLTRLYPGVRDALGALAGRGHRLGLCTNKPLAPTRALLAHFGLTGMFGAVLGGDSLPLRKPDPAPLLKTNILLGAGPMVFVGDSEVDAETAARAGVPFLLYTQGYRHSPPEALPHTAQFDDFAALPGLVAQISGEGRR